MFQVKQLDNHVCMTVKTELCINNADALKQALLDCLDQYPEQSMAVNLKGASDLDTSCLQLLMAAKKQWEDAGHSFVLEKCSIPVMQTLQVYGLQQSLAAQE